MQVFTTRVDTLFGVTYVALAAEHPFIKTLLSAQSVLSEEARAKLQNQIECLTQMRDRAALDKSKAGMLITRPMFMSKLSLTLIKQGII